MKFILVMQKLFCCHLLQSSVSHDVSEITRLPEISFLILQEFLINLMQSLKIK